MGELLLMTVISLSVFHWSGQQRPILALTSVAVNSPAETIIANYNAEELARGSLSAINVSRRPGTDRHSAAYRGDPLFLAADSP